MQKCKGLSFSYLAAGSDVKNVGDLHRNKKILLLATFTIPTVGQFDVSLQLPTSTNTTIADHGCHRWVWPPSAPHEAFRFTPMHQMDGRQPPEQADITFEAVEGVYGPQNTSMLWWRIIATFIPSYLCTYIPIISRYHQCTYVPKLSVCILTYVPTYLSTILIYIGSCIWAHSRKIQVWTDRW
jgi:hypothetical protein